MRDLDMSDVEADGRRDFIHSMYFEFDRKTDEELQELRYRVGPITREGNEYGILTTRVIDDLLLRRNTSLCEGCLDRTGCDMCCPPDFGWMADSYNRETEENMLGRPLFPNEY